MKLLDFPGAPNPRRVRMFLAEKALEIPVEVVDVAGGATRTEEFLERMNPFGGLPVLELDDGTCISESVAICRYIEGCQPAPPLMGIDPLDRGVVEMWQRRIEIELMIFGVGAYFRHTSPFFADKGTQVPALAEEAKRKTVKTLVWLDRVLGDRAFIAGARFTIADITALAAIDLGSPSVFELDSSLPNVSRWHREVSSRPSANA